MQKIAYEKSICVDDIVDRPGWKREKTDTQGIMLATIEQRRRVWAYGNRQYHRALGELHKLEGQSQPIVVNQNNLQQNNNIESLPDDDLDLFLSR